MADLTPVRPSIDGVNPGAVAASSGGDAIVNPRGKAILRVNNGGGSSINVTLAAQITSRPGDGTFPPQTVANKVVAVPAGASRVIGPIPPAFNDGNGKAQVTYSAVTSVTVEALEV
ncbi:MAG: hypothetical protein M5U20_08125 [Phycisphaerales bacterium]|nr:hypothetical protein [Phycisphaerales bacterium]